MLRKLYNNYQRGIRKKKVEEKRNALRIARNGLKGIQKQLRALDTIDFNDISDSALERDTKILYGSYWRSHIDSWKYMRDNDEKFFRKELPEITDYQRTCLEDLSGTFTRIKTSKDPVREYGLFLQKEREEERMLGEGNNHLSILGIIALVLIIQPEFTGNVIGFGTKGSFITAILLLSTIITTLAIKVYRRKSKIL